MTPASAIVAQSGFADRLSFDKDKIDLIKRTICKDASDDELQLFMHQCKRRGLDPLAGQIHAVLRYDPEAGRKIMKIQTGIDGFRLIAERTGRYEGQTPALWCGKDGQWVDVWLKDEPPAAAKVGVYKTGFREPLYGIALYDAYVQKKKDGEPNRMWAQMPENQLSKCAESLAFRKAFPEDLSGLYTGAEMDQSETASEPAATGKGSKEAAQAVAARKLAELPAPIDPMSDRQIFLEMIANATHEQINICLTNLMEKLAAKRGAYAKIMVSHLLTESFNVQSSKEITNDKDRRSLAVMVFDLVAQDPKDEAEPGIPQDVLDMWDGMIDIASTVHAFNYLKDRLSRVTAEAQTIYTDVLAKYGVKHSNAFKGAGADEKARKASHELWKIVTDLERSAPVTLEDVPS